MPREDIRRPVAAPPEPRPALQDNKPPPRHRRRLRAWATVAASVLASAAALDIAGVLPVRQTYYDTTADYEDRAKLHDLQTVLADQTLKQTVLKHHPGHQFDPGKMFIGAVEQKDFRSVTLRYYVWAGQQIWMYEYGTREGTATLSGGRKADTNFHFYRRAPLPKGVLPALSKDIVDNVFRRDQDIFPSSSAFKGLFGRKSRMVDLVTESMGDPIEIEGAKTDGRAVLKLVGDYINGGGEFILKSRPRSLLPSPPKYSEPR